MHDIVTPMIAMEDNKLAGVIAFVEVARGGSFAGAAQTLVTTPATVSRRIARLEDSLGVRLLTRTTRHVALTEAGANYLERCEPILRMLHDVDLSVADQTASDPRGRLRISLPGAFGRRYGAVTIADFRDLYPNVSLDIVITDQLVDLIEDNIDVAIRLSHLDDSSLVARRLASNERILCAAPAYLQKAAPRKIADLDDYACLAYSGYDQGRAWRLENRKEAVTYPLGGAVTSNDMEVLFEMVVAGCGVTMLPTFMANPAIRDGRLVRVLPGWTGPHAAIWAIHASRRLVPAKVRCFIDFLATRFARKAPWDN